MSKNAHYDQFEDRYGFAYGEARVTRLAHIEGRYHVLAVDTPFHHLQIAVSPTGRSVRVWCDSEEMGPPPVRTAR